MKKIVAFLLSVTVCLNVLMALPCLADDYSDGDPENSTQIPYADDSGIDDF